MVGRRKDFNFRLLPSKLRFFPFFHHVRHSHEKVVRNDSFIHERKGVSFSGSVFVRPFFCNSTAPKVTTASLNF